MLSPHLIDYQYPRSASVVLAYLLQHAGMSLAQAAAQVNSSRDVYCLYCTVLYCTGQEQERREAQRWLPPAAHRL